MYLAQPTDYSVYNLWFYSYGAICGGSVTGYGLERTRVVQQVIKQLLHVEL